MNNRNEVSGIVGSQGVSLSAPEFGHFLLPHLGHTGGNTKSYMRPGKNTIVIQSSLSQKPNLPKWEILDDKFWIMYLPRIFAHLSLYL